MTLLHIIFYVAIVTISSGSPPVFLECTSNVISSGWPPSIPGMHYIVKTSHRDITWLYPWEGNNNYNYYVITIMYL